MELHSYFSERDISRAVGWLRQSHRTSRGGKGCPGDLRPSGITAGNQLGSARASQVTQMPMFWQWNGVPGVYRQGEKLPSGGACLHCVWLEPRWPA